jgi:ABC-type Na+ efflux pump permease subunit
MTWLVAGRELRDQARDWRILSPLIVLTLAFPFLMNVVARQAVSFFAKYGTNLIAERLIPFSILIIGFFPITISLVVALESFVGEKERGTIEPLLSAPLRNGHLYFGKLIIGHAGGGVDIFVPETLLEDAKDILSAEVVDEDEDDVPEDDD